MTTKYADVEYWRARYAAEAPDLTFDWYHGYNRGLRQLITETLAKQARILVIGCGNSLLSEGLHADGYTDISSTDVVDTVVQRMAARRPDLRFEVMDARDLRYPDASFDAVIDKGTIDAVDVGPTNVPRICAEASRVLRPGGHFLVFSVDPPVVRRYQLDKPEYGWTVMQHVLKNELAAPCYAFVMTKAD